MGVSFKVSKTGTRYRPKPVLQSVGNDVVDEGLGNCKDSSLIMAGSNTRKLQGEIVEGGNDVAGMSGSSMSSKWLHNEVSFALNLFPEGYSIGRASENETVQQSMLQDMGKLLHPYDRTSETLFSAIESGQLPGDILDDIPCKYINGTLVCEVRDYRKLVPEQGSGPILTDGSPIVKRVRLRMSLENVVKDIPLMTDCSWTYGDLMEVESQILKALQPHLNLNPSPKLDRLCTNPVPEKLDLALCSMRRKRRRLPEVPVMSNSKTQGKKICLDRVPESSNCRLGDSGIISSNSMPHVPENLNASNVSSNNILVSSSKTFASDALASQSRFHVGAGTPRSMQDPGSGNIVNASVTSPAGQDIIFPHADNLNSSPSFHGKRENQDGQMSSLSSLNKRARPIMAVGLDDMQQQPIRQHMDNLHASDMNWNNALLQQPLMTRGIQGMRYAPKEEQFETGKTDGSDISGNKNDTQIVEAESSHFDPHQSRLQQRLSQHALMRSNYPQTPWNNLGQHVEKDGRKEDQHQKRKSIQSPRLSSGTLVQSPLSSKSGEFSSGSVGPNTGTVMTASMVSHKEKAGMTSAPVLGGAASLTSSANDSMQRQHQAQLAGKRRSNSLPKTPAMNGVGSPVSVSNMSGLYNANSPSVGTPPLADQGMLERFSKIEMVSVRHKLNCKRNKVDNYSIRKPNAYPAHHLKALLSKNDDYSDDTCKMPLSKSLLGGNMNVLKTRMLVFVQPERVLQGNVVSYVPKSRTRMIMSEKSSDGTVAMLYGEMETDDFLAVEDLLPTLPNTHMADLLAAQLSSLMGHEGYVVEEDHVQSKPSRMNLGAGSQGNSTGGPSNNSAVEMQHYGETVSSQVSNEDVKPTISGNASLISSQNLLGNTRMLPPGNNQALQMSQGLLSGNTLPPRPQQLDSQPSLQQQQQQQQQHQHQQQQQNQHSMTQQPHSQLQRSMMLGNNLSHLNAIGRNSNMQLGNHMGNKPSALQLQLFQQQQQPQMQRKMMMGIGTAMGMGNVSNNMGLSGLGSAMGMGTGRGMGGTGISASMMPISGMGNLGQNSMNLSQASSISNAFRSGTLTPEAIQRFKMQQNRATMLGANQSSIPGMSGTRQMHPGSSGLSMLSQNISRANMNPMQRAAMGHMGPPKVMAKMNMYMNQQQQHHQLQQQQLQQQLQQHQQQETNSPLHAVMSPPQVGSPSALGISQLNQQVQQQQQNSPQQMSQRTSMSPQQISSGAIHALSAGNPDACPASPQLSSQTLGSVGSITTSPMDLQGVNKSNSVSNAP